MTGFINNSLLPYNRNPEKDMKKAIIGIIFMCSFILSINAIALQFVKIDEKGNHYFRCEGSSSRAISVKIIDKGKYKVLAPYIGRIIHANSESEVALMVCGEAGENKKIK